MNKKIIAYFILFIIVAFFVTVGCSSSNWKEKAKIELNQNEKELLEIVELVKNNELEQDYDTLYKVPNKYNKLTKDGLIVVFQNNEDGIQVGFYVFRGMQTGSCYLMYSSGGEELIKENETGHPIVEIEYFKDDWYFVDTDY